MHTNTSSLSFRRLFKFAVNFVHLILEEKIFIHIIKVSEDGTMNIPTNSLQKSTAKLVG